ncbi:MAG: MarR family transcriptional regulator [Deltaproteobacteria bacterium]|nr:MAG: MarR family transcriptional regulator [Deltaproteobacteria bacterium]
MSDVARMFAALELVRRRLNKAIPTQQLSLLLAVAENPGITMPELCRLLDMPQGTVSRNVKMLSHYIDRSAQGVLRPRGYGLLRTQPDRHNPLALAVYLTGKGEALVQEIERILSDRRFRHGGAAVSAGQEVVARPVGLMH